MTKAAPVAALRREHLYVAMHHLNARTGRLWRWWDEKQEGWRDGDSADFADALADAYEARLSEPTP